jgi:hypothetical protein
MLSRLEVVLSFVLKMNTSFARAALQGVVAIAAINLVGSSVAGDDVSNRAAGQVYGGCARGVEVST